MDEDQLLPCHVATYRRIVQRVRDSLVFSKILLARSSYAPLRFPLRTGALDHFENSFAKGELGSASPANPNISKINLLTVSVRKKR